MSSSSFLRCFSKAIFLASRYSFCFFSRSSCLSTASLSLFSLASLVLRRSAALSLIFSYLSSIANFIAASLLAVLLSSFFYSWAVRPELISVPFLKPKLNSPSSPQSLRPTGPSSFLDVARSSRFHTCGCTTLCEDSHYSRVDLSRYLPKCWNGATIISLRRRS